MAPADDQKVMLARLRIVSARLRLLTAEVDEVVDGVNPGKTIDPEEDKAKTPMKKKRNLENKQKSRMVPLKPAPPSETIKADQEVDFPYDI